MKSDSLFICYKSLTLSESVSTFVEWKLSYETWPMLIIMNHHEKSSKLLAIDILQGFSWFLTYLTFLSKLLAILDIFSRLFIWCSCSTLTPPLTTALWSPYSLIHGLCSPWNSPGQNPGVGSHSLLQRIFPTQGWNPGLLHCRWIPYHLSHQGSPIYWVTTLVKVSLYIYWHIIASQILNDMKLL